MRWFVARAAVLCVLAALTQAAKILVLPIPDGASHQFNYYKIQAELAARGHDVVMVLPETNKHILAMRDNHTDLAALWYRWDSPHDFSRMRSRIPKRHSRWSLGGLGRMLGNAYDLFGRHCNALLNDTAVIRQIHAMQPDVLFGSYFTPCLPIMAAKLERHYVSLHTGNILYPLMSSEMVWPNPLSYNMQTGTGLTHPLTYAGRLRNALSWAKETYDVHAVFKPRQRAFFAAHGVTLEAARKLHALQVFTADWAIELPRPMAPSAKYVGGVLTGPAKALPSELQEFLDGSGSNGTVLVSTGTIITLSQEDILEMAGALSALPARVLWKLSKAEVPDDAAVAALRLSSTVKVVNWMPQNDVLGHRNMRAFVSQCGANSLYEAAYHGVPIMALPGTIPDQIDSAAKAARLGFCLPVIIGVNFSATAVRSSIERLLAEPQFKRNAQAVSQRLRARKNTPTEEAADWIEHVAATQSAYLQTPDTELPFAVRHSLDVVAGALSVAALAFAAASAFLRTLWWAVSRLMARRSRCAKVKAA